MTSSYIGQPQNRVDGPAKVTGAAKYAAEYNVPGLVYGWIVGSTIARGQITRIDAEDALKLPGVLTVFTHENRPHVPAYDSDEEDSGSLWPLRDAEIHFSAQPIALVVAETSELARYASSLVHVEYASAPHVTDLRVVRSEAYDPKDEDGSASAKDRGDAEQALASAEVRHEAEYTHPFEHHNPMEMHATTVEWHGDGKLTVYEKTQGAPRSQSFLAKVFGMKKDEVRVIASYVGGAFGSGLRSEHQLFLAVLAAREMKRSVRVVLTRQQMFTIGYRPWSIQRLALGANADGALQAIVHEALTNTSRLEDYTENDVRWSAALYNCPNIKRTYRIAQTDWYTPTDMRAPGGATGVWAIEAAMDELAYAANIDPLDLRLINYSDQDLNDDKPFSSKELRECYYQGAQKFGWARRNPAPRSMREGNELIGWGMATGIWEAMRLPASARAVLTDDGKLDVSSATTDIGTGTYTIMTQIAAETLGLPIEDVTFRLGDSDMPKAPIQGGSFTASSVGPAVKAACEAVGKRLLGLARDVPDSPLRDAKLEDVAFTDGRIVLSSDPSLDVSVVDAMRYGGVAKIEEEAKSAPDEDDEKRYAMYIHSAIFAEVRVDADFGTVRVTRVVDAVAAGRILNPKTARSQILGGVVWGIGMALHEETLADH
ncbi:MAG TPA: xanthine dehydrogenase family protein molybdopterin-binding subunit, partial [Burkholderiales bacterium]|nr:xanthine dehydrogenase family protein molybdopterin-binding subunit [Burkholderiales bacterium]